MYANLGQEDDGQVNNIAAMWFVLWSILPTIAGSPLDDMSARKQTGAPYTDAAAEAADLYYIGSACSVKTRCRCNCCHRRSTQKAALASAAVSLTAR